MKILVADIVRISGNVNNWIWIQGDEAFHSLETCEICGNETIGYTYNDDGKNYTDNPITVCHKCEIRGIY